MVKNHHAGTQVAQWDIQNKATRTSPTWLSFVLEVPLCNLRPSMANFVPCDRVVQMAYWQLSPQTANWLTDKLSRLLTDWLIESEIDYVTGYLSA